MVRDSLSTSKYSSFGAKSFAVWCVLVPLLVVLLVVFSVDSGSSPSWFVASPARTSSQRAGGDANLFDSSPITAGSSDHRTSHISMPPSPAPSPSPAGPVENFSEHSESKYVVSLSQGVGRTDIKLQRLEHGLTKARAAIREAVLKNRGQISPLPDVDYVPQGPVYRNAYVFHRSYLEMEKLFRVYVYEEGEPPLFHYGPGKSIYSAEGVFIYNMEMENQLRTMNPDVAHVYFLPFSVVEMVKYIYQPNTYDTSHIKRTIKDYVNIISAKYPYWNRSLGADHFMLSCHDWGPSVSTAIPQLYSKSIRVLCNANSSEGFNPSKDVTLPGINLSNGVISREMIGGPSASHRPILAFFAGGLHGPIRPLLLQHWKGKGDGMEVFEYLPQGISYYDMMRKSRFCICPSGFEVSSPRIVEAIYLECVPVLISDHYVPPFSDVLNWKFFSVQVSPEEIPKLKDILTSISSRRYIKMQRRLKDVQRHFVVNYPPKRFDVFYMILHSVWLRRLNLRVSPQ